jgi:hemerythrin-like domain-containing protein
MPLASLHEFEALDRTHAEVVRCLRELDALMARVDYAGADDEGRAVARRVCDFFNGSARQHHADEERFVFPSLLSSGDTELVGHVERLQQDHGWLEEDWLELEPMLDALADGVGAIDPDVLRHVVGVFGSLYLEHIALEESRVYPEAKRRVAALGERG